MNINIIKWSKGSFKEAEYTNIPFVRLSNYNGYCFLNSSPTIELYLRKALGFDEHYYNKRIIFRKAFVSIDLNTCTIWHHQVSKVETLIEGNIKTYIDYFNRI